MQQPAGSRWLSAESINHVISGVMITNEVQIPKFLPKKGAK
jgi:hypothetical protein